MNIFEMHENVEDLLVETAEEISYNLGKKIAVADLDCSIVSDDGLRIGTNDLKVSVIISDFSTKEDMFKALGEVNSCISAARSCND